MRNSKCNDMDSPITIFKSGVQNLLNNEIIPQDAAQDALGFITQDGRIKLIPGRLLLGADSGTTGVMRGLWYGSRVDGTLVLFRKTETKLQWYDGATWQDVITGLTSGTEGYFANYASLAGSFTFFISRDGYWKINNANPTSVLQMYDSSRNFHGRIFIDKGRTILWERDDSLFGGTIDRTGLYGSKIDPQNSTVYHTVTAEATSSLGGTLAFKTSPATVTITEANPGVVTLAAHGFTGGEKIVFATSGTLPTNLVAGTTYYVLFVDATTFQVAATLAGSAINTSGSVQAGTHTLTAQEISARNCFGVTITLSGSGEIFTDNFNGVLTGSLGNTGTINYATGAYTISIAGNGTANYQWENSNYGGLTDFRHSATRVASEGFIVPQDKGGDPIMNVLIGQDSAYYSLKQQRAYRFALDDTDLNPTNEIYYENMGIPSKNCGVSTQKGILFLNTSNPDKPEMTILQKNLVSATLLPTVLFSGFKFSLYDYSDCFFDTYERFIVISCKVMGATQNNRILLCNISDGTVDVSPYEARMFAKDASANFYVGSPLQENTYQIYNGFDDLDNPINAYWMGAAIQYGSLKSRQARWRFIREELKKFRKFYAKGMISLDQVVQVWISYDDAPLQQIGTIIGRGTYVDSGAGQEIGSNFIGGVQIGGDQLTNVFPYFCELKMKNQPKFRKRTIKLIPTGIGYFDVSFMSDFDILLFENRLPARFRSKQNVSLDGTLTDQP